MKLHHAGLFTYHPRRILNFYQRGLRLKKVSQALIDKRIIKKIFGINQDCCLAKLIFKDSYLEIFWPAKKIISNAKTNISGYNHISILVNNKKIFCHKLKRIFKIKLIKVTREDYFVYFIKDPDGNLIEVKD